MQTGPSLGVCDGRFSSHTAHVVTFISRNSDARRAPERCRRSAGGFLLLGVRPPVRSHTGATQPRRCVRSSPAGAVLQPHRCRAPAPQVRALQPRRCVCSSPTGACAPVPQVRALQPHRCAPLCPAAYRVRSGSTSFSPAKQQPTGGLDGARAFQRLDFLSFELWPSSSPELRSDPVGSLFPCTCGRFLPLCRGRRGSHGSARLPGEPGPPASSHCSWPSRFPQGVAGPAHLTGLLTFPLEFS